MTATVTETPIEVVTRVQRTTVLSCDGPGCANSWVVPQFPQSPPWLIVTRFNNPLWDGGAHPDSQIKHFCDLPCLRAWSQAVSYLWEIARPDSVSE